MCPMHGFKEEREVERGWNERGRTKESAEVIRTYSRAGEKQIDPAISGYPKRWKYRS